MARLINLGADTENVVEVAAKFGRDCNADLPALRKPARGSVASGALPGTARVMVGAN
jgi:hypothetical protein